MSAAESVNENLGLIEHLPVMTQSVRKIIQGLDDDSVSVEMVARMVSADPSLVAAVLKAVNSSLYGLHGEVTSIQEAVVILGFNTLRNIVCTVGFVTGIPHHGCAPEFDYRYFVRHSVAVGVCAKHLAKLIGHKPDVAFVSGLLHDIGVVVEAIAFPKEFGQALKYREAHDCQLYEAEQAVLGMDHARLGAELSRIWNFPTDICEAIGKHHVPDNEPTSPMADLIHVSEVLSYALEIGTNCWSVPPLSSGALRRLGADWRHLKPCFPMIECEYLDFTLMLGG